MGVERRVGSGWATHPGEILKEEFLVPLGLSGYLLAKRLGVPAQKVNDVVLQKRGISADMALRLAQFFGTSAEFWMNLQSAYELSQAQKVLRKKRRNIQPLNSGAA